MKQRRLKNLGGKSGEIIYFSEISNIAPLDTRKMKFIYLICLSLIFVCTSRAQENTFSIKEIVDTTMAKKSLKDFEKAYPAFFEDDDYVVSRTCSGEWGGTIKFKNKKTGIEYACSSTCPVAVNKLFGKYIVTNTLAHLQGFSEIIEIENPSLMSLLKSVKLVR